MIDRLRATIDKQTKVDTSGFYEDNDRDLDSRFMAGSRKPGDGQYSVIQPVTRSAREDELDFNLGMLAIVYFCSFVRLLNVLVSN